MQNHLTQAGNALNDATLNIQAAIYQLHQAYEQADKEDGNAHHTHIRVRLTGEPEKHWTSKSSVGDTLIAALFNYDILSGQFNYSPGRETPGEAPYISIYKAASVASREKVIEFIGCHCTENWGENDDKPPF